MKSNLTPLFSIMILVIGLTSCNIHFRNRIYNTPFFKSNTNKTFESVTNHSNFLIIEKDSSPIENEDLTIESKNDSLNMIPQNNIIHSKIVQKKTSKSIAHLEINKTPGVNQKINPNKPKRFNDLPTIFGLLNSSHKVKHVNLWLFIVTFLLIILILLTIFLIIFAGLDPPIWFILDLIIISLLIFFLIKLNKLNKVRTDKNKKRKNGKDIAVITVAVLFVLIMILNAFSS